MAIRLDPGQEVTAELREEIASRNRKLPDFKRLGGFIVVNKDFPRTASMKIKRIPLAEEIGKAINRSAVVAL